MKPSFLRSGMKIVIVGGGIGGLTAALALHDLGINVEVYEQSRELRELGVGINILPHAVKGLASLGLLPALDAAGVRTRELVYANRLGQTVWRELRGVDAGYAMPQFSILQVVARKLRNATLRRGRHRAGPPHWKRARHARNRPSCRRDVRLPHDEWR